jgi:hypothetical protein
VAAVPLNVTIFIFINALPGNRIPYQELYELLPDIQNSLLTPLLKCDSITEGPSECPQTLVYKHASDAVRLTDRLKCAKSVTVCAVLNV